MNKKKNICVIGAGWFGCHISLSLIEKGHKVEILEKENNIFLGSSGFNQFRLHRGYHYPRSDTTISEIKKNFIKFERKYKKFIYFPKKNFYCIAKEKSLIDSGTYKKILKANKIFVKESKSTQFSNIEKVFESNEGVIKNFKIINYYKKKLKKNIVFNKEIKNSDLEKIKKRYDYVIDCTNNTLLNIFKNKTKFILTFSVIYKSIKGKKNFPITIMDGSLPSLYPYADKKEYFILTHSKYTHLKKFNTFLDLQNYKSKIKHAACLKIIKKMQKSIEFFYNEFNKNLKYQNYFFSYKVLPSEKSAKREMAINIKDNLISVTSPKIANIFSFEEKIFKIIE